MKIRSSSRGQSLLEYTVLAIIIIAAILTMQVYIKRGLQGRWKDSVDQVGDQYNPGTTNAVSTYHTISNSETRVQAVQDRRAQDGYWTVRNDMSSSIEIRNAAAQIGY